VSRIKRVETLENVVLPANPLWKHPGKSYLDRWRELRKEKKRVGNNLDLHVCAITGDFVNREELCRRDPEATVWLQISDKNYSQVRKLPEDD
jgi:hypothetical protein